MQVIEVAPGIEYKAAFSVALGARLRAIRRTCTQELAVDIHGDADTWQIKTQTNS